MGGPGGSNVRPWLVGVVLVVRLVMLVVAFGSRSCATASVAVGRILEGTGSAAAVSKIKLGGMARRAAALESIGEIELGGMTQKAAAMVLVSEIGLGGMGAAASAEIEGAGAVVASVEERHLEIVEGPAEWEVSVS